MTGELLEAARAALPEMLDDLRRYVEVETPSDDKEALTRGLSFVDGLVASRVGAADTTSTVDGGAHGDVRVLDFAGTDAPPVLLLAHYDTVWPLGTLAEIPFAVDGDRITGPGVFDMKAGLVQLLWAIRIARAAGLPLPPLRLVLNGDEEIGSPASREVIERAAIGTRGALVFEAAAGPEGAVKTARKGVGLFTVHAEGVESHAGLDPTRGASAIDELARAVLTLHAAQDLSAGTSVNVGVIEGGTRSNVIAGRASGELDVRVSTLAEINRVEGVLAGLTPHHPKASLTVEGGWNRPVMERTPATAALYAVARAAAEALDLPLPEVSVGGASDGNFVAALGIGVLDGFGAVGDGAHARHEHATASGMVRRTALTAAVLRALA